MKNYSVAFFFCIIMSCGDASESKTASQNPADTSKQKPDSVSALVEPAPPGHAFVPPYTYSIPQGWTTEIFPIPIDFAPKIALKGFEDIRFTPGWGEPQSEEHWAYMFLWWVEGDPALDATTLGTYYTDYYSGLVGRNIESRKIPKNKIVPTRATINKLATAEGDKATYSGKIEILNYMTQTPITLNCEVHIRECRDQGRTAVFTEISPKPASHQIWKQFDTILQNFKCVK